MARLSNAFNITIRALPYSVPAAGQAVAIGPANGSDPLAAPGGLTIGRWNYSMNNAYGGGTMIPTYSAYGAYVFTAIGGHGNPDIFDTVVFDFSDATWTRHPQASISNRDAGYTDGESNMGPWYEINGAPYVPAPTHPYRSLVYLPPSLGGAANRGSAMYVTRGACLGTGNGARIAISTHKIDLNTFVWSRVNDGTGLTLNTAEQTAVFDPVAGRYYLVRHNLDAFNTLPYLRASDWTWQQTASHPYPPEWAQNSGWGSAFLYPTQNWILNHQGSNGLLRAFQLSNPSVGWTQLNVSGLPVSEGNLWAYYPPDGRFYFHASTGSVVHRLIPPASSPLTAPWVYDTFTPGGAALPNADVSGGLVSHKSRFFYVPSIQCLAWIAGGANHVIIFKPPS